MPGLQDDIFGRSVVYLCEHSERGALGLVINKPSDINLQNLFERVDLPLSRADLIDTPVFQGGPVQTERGFVLHESLLAEQDTDETTYTASLSMAQGLEMTTSRDVLEAISTGAGPRKVLISLGYSAWAQGQLESEIAGNSWLTVEADKAIIFDTPIENRYARALSLLGVDPSMLSAVAGHA